MWFVFDKKLKFFLLEWVNMVVFVKKYGIIFDGVLISSLDFYLDILFSNLFWLLDIIYDWDDYSFDLFEI